MCDGSIPFRRTIIITPSETAEFFFKKKFYYGGKTMDIIGFIICLVLFAVITSTLFAAEGSGTGKLSAKIKSNALLISGGCTGGAFLLAVFDIAGIIDFGGYTRLPLWTAITGIAVTAYLLYRSNIPEGIGSLSRYTLRAFAVSMALELFVFNFNSAHLFMGDYKENVLNPSDAVCTNYNSQTGTNNSDGYMAFEYKGLNMPVGTLTVDVSSDKNASVTVDVDMTDDTFTAFYRDNIAVLSVIRGNGRSATIPCNFSGTVYDLRIELNASEGETLTVRDIRINQPITLDVSLIRLGVMLGIALAVYMLTLSPTFAKDFRDSKKRVRLAAWILTGVLAVTALYITNCGRYAYSRHSLINDFKSTNGNQITEELVDAFEDGRVTLDTPVSSGLANLENPYDGSQRAYIDRSEYLWDHLLFEGEYYSYYGIAPVLLLFLPYHLITGYYFPTVWACFIFGVLGIIFLTKFYLCFAEKFFGKVRSSVIFSGLFILQLCSGIWFCFMNPMFYEIAQNSGFVCVAAGAYFLMSSNVIGGGQIKNTRLALSAVFLSLAVLCRPTLAVYCVAALLFIFAGFRKKKSLYTADKGSKGKYYVPYFACALLPFAVIGSVQMIYNYMRFGSVFDFGIQYSLTINDFTAAQFHTHFSIIGYFNYLFMPPKFLEAFPFIGAETFRTFNPQGYYFIATASTLGLVWKALPTLAYSKSLTAYRVSESRNKKMYALLLTAVCIVCPAVIIFSIWESGYGARYCVDFAWQIIIGAYTVAFVIYEKSKENTQKHLNKLMTASAFVCLALNFGQIYEWINPSDSLSTDMLARWQSFARLFEFWR